MFKQRKHISEITWEQIALGISVAAKCRPCFQFHLEKARKAGISEVEIKEIVNLARQARAISEQEMDEFIVQTLSVGIEHIQNQVCTF